MSRDLTICLTPSSRRRPPPILPIPTGPHNVRNAETEERLRQLRTGYLKINGIDYETKIDDLKYLSELGNGTSGHVVKMMHKPSNAVIAVKQMRRTGNDEETKRITMDLDTALKSHDCPFIVQCLGCFITQAEVWICMELMSTCFDKLQKKTRAPIPEMILRHVTEATVNALYYLKERHDVIHRDVKPSNILIDERGIIKMCDFGISGRLVDSKAKTRSAGCAAYMAPERIDPKKPEYDIRADVWSLGITLVELATGAYPYKDCKTDFEVLTKVLDSDPPSLPDDAGFSEEFRDFVKRCLTKDYRQRPKYLQLLEHPFLKHHVSELSIVAEWFHRVTKESGIVLTTANEITNSTASTVVMTSMPSTSTSFLNRLTTTTSPPVTSSINPQPLNLPNNFESQLKLNMNSNAVANSSIANDCQLSTNPFMMGTTNTLNDPTAISHQFPKLTEQFRSTEVPMTGGYQKLPFRASQTTMLIEPNEVDLNGFMGLKYNRLYTQSPQLPRKVYNDPNPNSQLYHPHQNPAPLMHHLGRESPMMPRKFPPRETVETTANYSPYKPLPFQQNNSPSPMMRRRYQEGGHPVSDEEYRILHGNTSPIVLQRFYHQQNQIRDQQDQIREMRLNTSSPFAHSPAHTSSIPIKAGGSPRPSQRYHQSPSMVAYRFQQQHEQLPNFQHASQIPQLQNRYMCNGNGNGNGIPYKHHQPQPHQIVYDNVASRPQIPCPGSPQLDRLRANMEKINFYERNQKLPVESSYQLEMNRQNGDLHGSDMKNKDNKGWLNSVAGIVKTYIRSRFDREQQQNAKENNEKLKSMASVSPMPPASTNPFAQTPPNPIATMKASQQNSRHASPDPPPRKTRGSQSPLILRRKLELASTSPMLGKRLISPSPPPPMIPPRGIKYNSDSVPASPQHLQTRINYTPEPQRRYFRPLDQ